MTQSVFRDALATKQELKELHGVCCVFAALVFLVLGIRGGLAALFALALCSIWSSLPFWPVAGLFFAVSFLIPQR
jgi:hypothetical protein